MNMVTTDIDNLAGNDGISNLATQVFTASKKIKHRPRILCLDGGGVYGLSELLILRRLMNDVTLAANLDSPALPCKYFDLIGGVGMGGLVAVMIGRLCMVTSQK